MRPFVHMRPVYFNGTLGDSGSVIVATTAKNNSCTYPYYVPVNCTEDIYAYQVQIHTFSRSSANARSPSRQQQITAVCAVPEEPISTSTTVTTTLVATESTTITSTNDTPSTTISSTITSSPTSPSTTISPTITPSPTTPSTTVTPSPTTPSTTISSTITPSPTTPSTTISSTITPSPTSPSTTVTPSPTTPSTTISSTITPSPTSPSTTVTPSPTTPSTTISSTLTPSPTSPSTTVSSTTTRGPPQPGSKRGMAFIVDSYGLDDTAFNSSIDAIVNFVNLYNMDNLRIMLIENTNAIFERPAFKSYTNATFLSAISSVFARRTDTRDVKLDSVFSTILEKSKDLDTPYNYIFYVTQTGGKVKDTLLKELRESKCLFNISCIGVSAYKGELSKDVLTQLEEIGSLQTADNWYDAMLGMVNVTQTYDKENLPKPPERPQCVGVQASIYIAVDLSIGINETIRTQMQTILRLFPTAFNLAYDISVTKEGCSEEDKANAKKTYKGKTRISGWSFFEDVYGVNDPTFCVSNLASVMSSIGADGGDEEPIYNDETRNLLTMFNDTLSNKCKCSRYDDKETKKIIIWMPVFSYKSEEKYKEFFKYPYKHYVIPFGKDYKLEEDDFYYGLSQNDKKFNGLLSIKNSTSEAAEAVVKELWDKICRKPSNSPS
ncbi:hypothetical protein Y032_0136g1969 [Ancylostoma ceylanicum]|nr:hypothetical protein Y032_0136g1969 [Ancylostoma ceylanicum]